jgi:hypothetical protein
VVNQVLDEIGVDLNQAVCSLSLYTCISLTSFSSARRLLDCRSRLFPRRELLRLLAEAARMTTYKHVWIACASKYGTSYQRDDVEVLLVAFERGVLGSAFNSVWRQIGLFLMD